MLKTHQMKMLVGATIGILEENLLEEKDPKVKQEIEKYKAEMEELFMQISLAEFMEHMIEGVEVEA